MGICAQRGLFDWPTSRLVDFNRWSCRASRVSLCKNLEDTYADEGCNRTIDEATKLLKAYTAGDRAAIHPSLRLAVFKVNVLYGGKSAYEAVKQEYGITTSVDGKEICLVSLGQVQSSGLINEFLQFQFSDQVAIQDVHSGSIALGANPKARDATWQWIKDNWDTVDKKLSTNPAVLSRYLKKTLERFASHEVERDIVQFFEGKDQRGYDRSIVQVSDSIRANADYRERDDQLVLEWLKTHGYA